MINPTAPFKVNGVGKICWAGRDFNCIEKVCGFVIGQGGWVESLSAPSHCWVLCWNLTLANRQKNQLFQADRDVGLLFVLISHQCMRSSKNYLPECWLKELIFPELSYSPLSSNALDKHFELGARWYFYGGIEKKSLKDFSTISVMSVFYRMTRKGVFYLSAEGLLTVIYMRK